MSPSPKPQTFDGLPSRFRISFAASTLVLSIVHIQKSTGPDFGLIHRMQVISDGHFTQLNRQRAIDLATQL